MPDLIPFEHFIPVKQDLSDLIEMTQWLKSHDKESQKIALNMFLIPVHTNIRK